MGLLMSCGEWWWWWWGGGVEGMLVVGALLVLDFFRRWEFC